MVPNLETRASLLLRLRNTDDHAAWQEFHEIYQQLVYRLARGRGLQDADAQELAQDVMLAVAGAIERWEPDAQRGSFRGWLTRIARNLVVNHLIRQGRRERGSGDSDIRRMLERVPDREAVAFDHELRRQTFYWAANRARAHFQPATWEAFWKTCVEGRRVCEVAVELNMTAGAIYVSRSRVMARIRQLVEARNRE